MSQTAVKILSLPELEAAAARASFAQAGRGLMTTTDIRPIDMPLRQAERLWSSHPLAPLAPRLSREERFEQPARPESIRAYYPPEQSRPWTETIRTRARGARIGEWALLMVGGESDGGDGHGAEMLWGLRDGESELRFGRGLELGLVLELLAGLPGAFAELERSALDASAGPGAPGSGGGRL